MKWQIKALLQNFLSRVPAGEIINFLLTRIARQLPMSDALLTEKIRLAKVHLDTVTKYFSPSELGKLRFHEFGAGWELVIPIAYYFLGVRQQTISDVSSLVRINLVNDSLRRAAVHITQAHPVKSIKSVAELEQNLGIKYIAPLPALNNTLPSASFDVITNTDTLEHVRVEELQPIINNCFRLLTPGGLMSSIIDFRDHFFYFDASISPYNFLTYSQSTWNKYNSPIHFQNRLRLVDYLTAFTSSGFEILNVDSPPVTSRDRQWLATLPINQEFKSRYNSEEMAIQGAHIICRKPLSSAL